MRAESSARMGDNGRWRRNGLQYHGWVITPTAEGCHVLTEETQQGEFFLDVIGRQYPGALYCYHQDWVERLARSAEAEAANAAA